MANLSKPYTTKYKLTKLDNFLGWPVFPNTKYEDSASIIALIHVGKDQKYVYLH